jgi:hypothetical protein
MNKQFTTDLITLFRYREMDHLVNNADLSHGQLKPLFQRKQWTQFRFLVISISLSLSQSIGERNGR